MTEHTDSHGSPPGRDGAQRIRLASGALSCDIDAAAGGCIRCLRFDGIDVLRRAPDPLTSARQASSYPLVPYSNRIAGGLLQWRGRTWQLALNNAPEPHAIHGIGWQLPWDVASSSDDRAELVLRHAGDHRWPFAFDSRQVLRLTPTSLDLLLSVTNTGSEPAPAGVGWHPFFTKRPGARVQVRTLGRWEMGAGKLPTVRVPHAGLDGSTDGLDVDHCFDGWSGEALLDDDVLQCRITSGLRFVVVFTTPARDVIALEPVSHVNNVYGAGAPAAMPNGTLGDIALAPGETLQAAMRIEVTRRG